MPGLQPHGIHHTTVTSGVSPASLLSGATTGKGPGNGGCVTLDAPAYLNTTSSTGYDRLLQAAWHQQKRL